MGALDDAVQRQWDLLRRYPVSIDLVTNNADGPGLLRTYVGVNSRGMVYGTAVAGKGVWKGSAGRSYEGPAIDRMAQLLL